MALPYVLLPRNPLYGPPVRVLSRHPTSTAVRHALEQAFQLFAQRGSVRAALAYLRHEGLTLPHRMVRRGMGSRIVWQLPCYDALFQYRINLTYAGVYYYGRRAVRHVPVAKTQQVVRQPRAAWAAFLPGYHPGYLTLE